LKLKCDEPLSDVAFNFNLRRYTLALSLNIVAGNDDTSENMNSVSESQTKVGQCTLTR
jgi:hypothetical protein